MSASGVSAYRLDHRDLVVMCYAQVDQLGNKLLRRRLADQ